MPNGQDTTDNELELDIIEDESAEDTQDTQGEGESEEVELNLETGEAKVDQRSPAEENAKRQEEAWLLKVTSGKASVEDAPKWLHGRLNSRLEATNKLPETEEVVKRILEQKEQEQEFKAIQAQIPKLTPQQAKELQARFAEYKPLGNAKALRTALDVMGLSQRVKEAEQRGVAKGRMSLPQSGQPSVKKSDQAIGGVPSDVIQDDKKWNEMIRQGKKQEA